LQSVKSGEKGQRLYFNLIILLTVT